MPRILFPLPAAAVQPAENLATLAAVANREHAAGAEASRQGLEHYRKAGEALLRAKEQCGHGRWLKWLQENVKFSQPRAWRYMQLAKLFVTNNLADPEALEDAWRRLSGNAPAAEEEEAQSAKEEAQPAEEENQPAENGEGGEVQGEPEQEFLGDAMASPHYITLEQWRQLTKQQQHALAIPEKSQHFNYQGKNPGIEWALWSWNPVSGCEHNCPYCYARDIATRFYKQGFQPSLYPDRLKAPQATPFPSSKIAAEKDPTRQLGLKNVFVCSMADLFGRWVPREWIELVLAEVQAAPQWNFLFLTKFPIRMAEFDFPGNAWVGTTVDCQARVANAEKAFRKVKAGVKWLSLEPMIERLHFEDLGAFQWIVLGGASASSQTPEWHPPREWVWAIEKEARRLKIPFYEKPNLHGLLQGYPGQPVFKEPEKAPGSLCYLPEK